MSELNTNIKRQEQMSHWVIDRIESGSVVLNATHQDEELTLPLTLFPQDIREGDTITLNLSIDSEVSNQARAEVSAQIEILTAEDDGDDFSL